VAARIDDVLTIDDVLVTHHDRGASRITDRNSKPTFYVFIECQFVIMKSLNHHRAQVILNLAFCLLTRRLARR
jgi:hypothetical protein